MEPISKHYRDPVVVLDFQSLYPSIVTRVRVRVGLGIGIGEMTYWWTLL